MAVVNARALLEKATEGKYAVGAFNITNIIQMEGVLEAAVLKNSPLIIQTSVTPSKFIGPKVLGAVYRALAESVSIPVCLHLDHCDDVDYCKECADAGYSSIMIDASQHEFAENVRQTKEVTDYCHNAGSISVEGELGTVSGVEDQVRVAEDEALMCDPEKGLEFVDLTGVDIFAPAIGTAHGFYKTKDPKIDFNRLEEVGTRLREKNMKTPLVVHGTTGLKSEVIQKLISLGGSKFNVSTDLKHIMLDATYDYMTAHRGEYNPGKIDKAFKKAIVEAVKSWIDLFGSAGKAE